MTAQVIEAPNTETLVCENCSIAWEREVVRGRKPRYCENCVRFPVARKATEVPALKIVENKVTAKRKHREFATLLQVAMARIPVMLVGPAGSGKTTAGRQVAQALDLSFVTESCSPQMSKWDLMGFMGAAGTYVPGVIREAFENGGVVLLDEIDASNPAVLVAINLIASCAVGETVTFPDGNSVPRHADFVLITGGNTYGDGASDEYVGRSQLDAATLDRFATITWNYDEDVERAAAGHDEWTTYVQSIRKAAAEMGVRLMVTPRASINGAALLKSGMDRKTVEKIVLFKGLDEDAQRSLKAAARRV